MTPRTKARAAPSRLAQRPADLTPQVVEVGLEDEPLRPARKRLALELRVYAREEEDRRVRVGLSDPAAQLRLRRGRRLEYLTLAWNLPEAVGALAAGPLAGSDFLWPQTHSTISECDLSSLRRPHLK
jgi:hypothetical protein